MALHTIEEVRELLDAIPAFSTRGASSADFSLDRFKRYCQAAGNPQQQFPAIHVAGTNGKGSTCQLMAAIYIEAGYCTGLFTSPHLMSYNERFSINGRLMDNASLIRFFNEHESLVKSFRLTYFEISAAVAFWWFARRQVDVAVIETGLGGRLDATNVITPLASLITTIALDHTDVLGDTIQKIAAEKAGIIKKNVPVVLGNVPGVAKKIILQKAKEQQAPVHESLTLQPQRGEDGYILVEKGKKVHLRSTLEAPVQACNIALAWMSSGILQRELPAGEPQRRKGIQEVGRIFPNAARFAKLYAALPWYFDGAHNLQAVKAMKQMVKTMQPVDETTVVFSLMQDKLNKKILLEFSEFKKKIYYTLPVRRAAAIEKIRGRLKDVHSFPVTDESRNKLLNELSSELVIFAGSFYFYPTVRDWISTVVIDR